MRYSIKVREKPKASQKDTKARTNINFLPIGQKENESKIHNFKPNKDKKGRAIPLKRQASLSPTPRISGSNLLTPLCFMTPGKQTVPSGTGIPRMTGKKPTQTTKTGRRLRNGSHKQVGLRKNYPEALPLSPKEIAACIFMPREWSRI